MAKLRFVFAAMLLVWATACIPSLYPLYTEDVLTSRPGLLGRWQESDGDDFWAFSGEPSASFYLTIRENDGFAQFRARTLQLEHTEFLDIVPEELNTGTSFYRDHFIPAHSFYRFELQGDTLRVWPLDPDWVKSAIENNEVAGEFKMLPEDTLFLTSPPRELQQMVVYAVGRPDTFGDALILVRKN